MIASGLQGIEFIAVNTDLQALRGNRASVKIQVGGKLTKGLGAGANPDIGRQAAVEDTEKICDALEGADMVFITCGLGGGTGTGAAPVVASIASQLGGETSNVLTIAVVTLPFALEGKRRMGQAMDGLAQLRECVDSVIAIPNDRLLQSVARNTPISEAFRIADDVLRQAVQGISDIIIVPGLINLDFADVRAVMKGMGQAVMGTGIGQGENRATEAAQRAISNPLLEDTSIEGARGHHRQRHRRSRPLPGGGLRRDLPRLQDGRPRCQRDLRRGHRRGHGQRGQGHRHRHRLQQGSAQGGAHAGGPVELREPARGGHAPPAADAGGFYRKTPTAKAASGGSGRFLDLDVPAFLRKAGGSSGGE